MFYRTIGLSIMAWVPEVSGMLPYMSRMASEQQASSVVSLTERVSWQPPEPSPFLARFEARCHKAKQQPFLDERPMSEAVCSCAWRNFRQPLGHFEHQGRANFKRLLGYGVDGIVWKVTIDERVYALKVVSLFMPCVSAVVMC